LIVISFVKEGSTSLASVQASISEQ